MIPGNCGRGEGGWRIWWTFKAYKGLAEEVLARDWMPFATGQLRISDQKQNSKFRPILNENLSSWYSVFRHELK